MKFSLFSRRQSFHAPPLQPTALFLHSSSLIVNLNLICAVAIIMGFLVPSTDARVAARPSLGGSETIISDQSMNPESSYTGQHTISGTSADWLRIGGHELRNGKPDPVENIPEDYVGDDPNTLSSFGWGSELKIPVVESKNAKEFFGSHAGVEKAKRLSEKGMHLNFLELHRKDIAKYNWIVSALDLDSKFDL